MLAANVGYRANHNLQRIIRLDQSLCLAFAQLNFCKSLHDVEACARSVGRASSINGFPRQALAFTSG
jgi:hypothetical protein